VAGAPAVLADADLVAEHVADDAGSHRRRRLEIGLAVAGDEEHAGIERLPFVELEVLDQQPLALADAVLLASDGNDRVAHDKGNARFSGTKSVAATRTRRPIRTWGRSPIPPPRRRSCQPGAPAPVSAPSRCPRAR